MEQEHDELRYEFTAWLKVVAHNARIDYIRKLKTHAQETGLDSQLIETLAYEPRFEELGNESFNFEDDKIVTAFSKLPKSLKKILEMTYIRNMSSAEIAKKLKCSLQYVYARRSMALKMLRTLVEEEIK